MKKTTQFVAILSLTVLTALVLYAFRAFDDNRLTSWDWVFSVISIRRIILLLIPGAVAALLLAKSPVPGRYPGLFLFAVSFAATALFWHEPEMIVDSSRYFTQAKHVELYGAGYFLREWGKSIYAWTDLPLMPLIYGLIFRYAGETRIYIQLFTSLLFSLTVVLTYLTGKTLWDRDTGFFGGMFMLGIPYIFAQVPLMMTDTPAMFFFTLAVFAFIVALQRGELWMAAAAAAIFLAVFSKYSIWLMLSLLFIITCVTVFEVYRSPRAGISVRTCWLRAGSIILFAACSAGVVMLLKADVLASQMQLLLTFQKPGLARWSESFLSTFFFQVHPAITVLAGFSSFIAWKKRDPKWLITGWLILVIIALRIERSRYVIVAMPGLSLMAAYGLNALKGKELKRCIIFSSMVWSLIIAFFAYLSFMQQTSAQNLQLAGDFINTLPVTELDVITLPRQGDDVNIAVSVPLLDLYTDKRVCYNYTLRPRYAPPAETIAVSPLRFTWEYRNPAYYDMACCRVQKATAEVHRSALVIIAGEAAVPGSALPHDIAAKVRKYEKSKIFSITDDIFYHQTIVAVYY